MPYYSPFILDAIEKNVEKILTSNKGREHVDRVGVGRNPGGQIAGRVQPVQSPLHLGVAGKVDCPGTNLFLKS